MPTHDDEVTNSLVVEKRLNFGFYVGVLLIAR